MSRSIHISINRKALELDSPVQMGAALKKLAGIPLEDTIFLDHPGSDDEVIGNDTKVTLHNGAHLHSAPPATYGSHHVTVSININGKPYHVAPHQTGTALKHLGGIPLGDTLFLDHPGKDDEVIGNDTEVTLHNGAHLHSAPPATYGNCGTPASHIQPDGWTFLIYSEFKVPEPYEPGSVRLLVKLPPLFPEARPDMFWVSPAVAVGASAPKGTSPEVLLGESWQRFSWHLADGAWKPGVSTLDDFLRCIRARFVQKD